MHVHLRSGSAHTILRPATLSILPSHSILIPDQPVPTLTQAGSQAGFEPGNPGSSALEADILTTRPTGGFHKTGNRSRQDELHRDNEAVDFSCDCQLE